MFVCDAGDENAAMSQQLTLGQFRLSTKRSNPQLKGHVGECLNCVSLSSEWINTTGQCGMAITQ